LRRDRHQTYSTIVRNSHHLARVLRRSLVCFFEYFFVVTLSPVSWPLFCQQFLRLQLCSLNSLNAPKKAKKLPPDWHASYSTTAVKFDSNKSQAKCVWVCGSFPLPCPLYHPLIENPLWQLQLFPLRFNSTARHFCFHYHFHCSSGVFKVLILRQYLLDFSFCFGFGFALEVNSNEF